MSDQNSNVKNSHFILMNQKVGKKNKEWHMQHIYSFLSFDVKNTLTRRRMEQLDLWKDYYCLVDQEKQKKLSPITSPYGYSLGMEWVAYPLIESKLEQLVGEYMLRELKKKTYVINKRAKSEKLDHLFTMITEEIMRDISQELQEDLGFTPETENQEMELPENIEEFFESDYKTESEEVSDIILDVVLYAKKQKEKLRQLFLDFLVQDECIHYITEKNGHPSIERADIFETFIDWNPDEEIQRDPQYIIHSRFLSFNDIINDFDLTEEEEKTLRGYSSYNRAAGVGITSKYDKYGYDDRIDNYDTWFKEYDGTMQYRAVEMVWISKKKIQVKVSLNKKTNKEIYHLLPEDYKKRKNDKIKSIWIDEKRKCIMVGPDLVLDWGPLDERHSFLDNLKKDKILAGGIRRNYSSGFDVIRSAAKKLKQLQDFASEILFELRLAMRRNNSRVLVYDAAQIPKQFLKTGGYANAINRVMHHAKKDQFLIINSQDRNARYAFNQFTSIDMSSKGLMMDLFNVLALIEDLASKFLGVTPQREGNINKYETASGAERSVTQSTARTEIFFAPFETYVEAILQDVILKAKYTYEENEISDYIFGDLKNKFFQIYPSFLQDDIGVYIGDSSKEQRKKMIIDRAAEQALSNAQTPDLILSLVDVLNADFSSEAHKILKRGIDALEKMRMENNEAVKEAEEIRAKALKEDKDEDRKVKREGYQKDILVAEIYAKNKSVTEAMKNETSKKIKAAELEKEYLLNSKQS